MQKLYQEAKKIAGMFHSIRFEWVPREHNIVANQLTREAYGRALEQVKDAGGVFRTEDVYWVLSSKEDQFYEVNPDKHICTCPDHARRKRDCKHIKRIQELVKGK